MSERKIVVKVHRGFGGQVQREGSDRKPEWQVLKMSREGSCGRCEVEVKI